jgi:hypothetical protein
VQEAFKASEISARNASPEFSGVSTTTTHCLLSADSSAQAAGSITNSQLGYASDLQQPLMPYMITGYAPSMVHLQPAFAS